MVLTKVLSLPESLTDELITQNQSNESLPSGPDQTNSRCDPTLTVVKVVKFQTDTLPQTSFSSSHICL